MREVEGRTYSEIAEVLNTSVPAVEALLFRARTNLKSRRNALDVLTLVPVPGSLSSFFGGGGGGVLAAGGAAVGGDLLLKAAAVVVSGVVAGGLGFKTVKAIAKPAKPQPQFDLRYHAPAVWASPVQRIIRARVRQDPALARFTHPARIDSRRGGGKLTRVPANDRPSQSGLASSDQGSSGASSGAAPASPAASEGGSSSGGATDTVKKIVASVPTPTVPPTPPTPPAPVSVPVPLPPPPTPTLPSVTVTVPTVTVPLPGK
jgi:hypothetical protein